MNITLKDGKVLELKGAMTVQDIAATISEGLARVALAAIVDDKQVDMDYIVDKNCSISILTAKDIEGMHIMRHTTAHVLAQAVKSLYPQSRLGVGPATDNGFFYDIELDKPISVSDLATIEKQMSKIVAAKQPIKREDISRDNAIALFDKLGERYKVELLAAMPQDTAVSIYRQGDFVDLCKGPHLNNTSKVGHFKLTQLTGAYWKGDQSNRMLSRIYGVVFDKKAELAEYLNLLEEAKKRDHQKLGREIGIFLTDENIGQGLPLFAPKGAKIMQTLIRWVEDEECKRGFVLTRTPQLAKSNLYKMSGHWDHYRDSMFVIGEDDNSYMALRPMTCPFQFMIYKNTPKSYRDLPIRYAETATLFRNESSGEMHGLIRVRQFTLSDGHIVCMPSQLEQEFEKCLNLTYYLLDTLGLQQDVAFRFSKHDPSDKGKYIDAPDMWRRAESELKSILDKQNIKYVESVGDAAFYGPKLDIQIKNVWGKEDTIITIQVDIALADRFDMEYVAEDGSKKRPLVIHRSSIGCYERTLAILIEKYAGALPLWLAPVQVKVMSLTDRTADKAKDISAQLLSMGISAESDNRSEKIGYKIREAQLEKVPYMLIIGDKEASDNTVAVRTRKGGDLGTMSIDAFLDKITREIRDKSKDV